MADVKELQRALRNIPLHVAGQMPRLAADKLDELEADAARAPGLRDESNGEAGDFTTLCDACHQETDEPHSAKDCVAYRNRVSDEDGRIMREHYRERLAQLENEAANYKALFDELCGYVAFMCEHFGDKRDEIPCDAWRLRDHVMRAKTRLAQLEAFRAEVSALLRPVLELETKATPGRWVPVTLYGADYCTVKGERWPVCHVAYDDDNRPCSDEFTPADHAEDDVRLIAAARNSLPALRAALERVGKR